MEKTFENFIVDHSNFFAHAMSKRVAEHPGEDYNPFIIIGDHGLGKSHLACAIKAEIENAQRFEKVVSKQNDTKALGINMPASKVNNQINIKSSPYYFFKITHA